MGRGATFVAKAAAVASVVLSGATLLILALFLPALQAKIAAIQAGAKADLAEFQV